MTNVDTAYKIEAIEVAAEGDAQIAWLWEAAQSLSFGDKKAAIATLTRLVRELEAEA